MFRASTKETTGGVGGRRPSPFWLPRAAAIVLALIKAHVLALNTPHVLRRNMADVLAPNKAHVLRLNTRICPVFTADTKAGRPKAAPLCGGGLLWAGCEHWAYLSAETSDMCLVESQDICYVETQDMSCVET